jgi:hypothetical protein
MNIESSEQYVEISEYADEEQGLNLRGGIFDISIGGDNFSNLLNNWKATTNYNYFTVEENDEKNNNNLIIIIIVSAVLLFVIGFFMFRKK